MALDTGTMTFIYEENNDVLGGIVLGVIKHSKTQKIGFVKYIFTAQKARGRGVAKALLDSAITWFKEENCHAVAACVEGYNSSSSNLFYDFGFRILSLKEQLKSFKRASLKVWFKGNHVFDLGHFWWSLSLEDDVPLVQSTPKQSTFIASAILTALLMVLFLIRQGVVLEPSFVYQVPLAMFVIFTLRFMPIVITSKVMQYPLVYRFWGTGTVIATFITGVVGGLFIAYGGFYPKVERFRIKDHQKPIALLSIFSAYSLLIGTVIIIVLPYVIVIPQSLFATYQLLKLYLPMMTMLDLLMAFFPVNSMLGGRIRMVYKKHWLVLLFMALVLFVLSYIV